MAFRAPQAPRTPRPSTWLLPLFAPSPPLTTVALPPEDSLGTATPSARPPSTPVIKEDSLAPPPVIKEDSSAGPSRSGARLMHFLSAWVGPWGPRSLFGRLWQGASIGHGFNLHSACFLPNSHNWGQTFSYLCRTRWRKAWYTPFPPSPASSLEYSRCHNRTEDPLNNYASSTSGEAYRDRRLTTNFELWVEIFCVPTCFHVKIPKPCLSAPREKISS